MDFATTDDGFILEEAGEDYEAAAELAPPIDVSSDALISIGSAAEKLGPEVLATLEAKFKGKLTEVRHLDARDLIF